MEENEKMREAEEQYSAGSIQVLEGLEAVRKDHQCILETSVSEVFIILYMR